MVFYGTTWQNYSSTQIFKSSIQYKSIKYTRQILPSTILENQVCLVTLRHVHMILRGGSRGYLKNFGWLGVFWLYPFPCTPMVTLLAKWFVIRRVKEYIKNFQQHGVHPLYIPCGYTPVAHLWSRYQRYKWFVSLMVWLLIWQILTRAKCQLQHYSGGHGWAARHIVRHIVKHTGHSKAHLSLTF